MMNTSEEAAIAWQCERLINLYSNLLDARDFDALARLYTEDGVLARPSAPDTQITGRETILRSMKERPANGLTRHLATNIVIDVLSSTRARGMSYTILYRSDPAKRTPGGFALIVGAMFIGSYEDEFVLTAEGWRFARRLGAIHLASSSGQDT